MAQQAKVLAPTPEFTSSGSTWQKERTNTCKLSSDTHMHHVGHLSVCWSTKVIRTFVTPRLRLRKRLSQALHTTHQGSTSLMQAKELKST